MSTKQNMSTPTEAHHQIACIINQARHPSQFRVGLQLLADSEARAVEAALAEEKNLHAQTRTVVEELNMICTDLKNAGGPPFVRSEAIRLLREDQAQLRGMLAKERERVRVLEEAITDHRAFDKRQDRDALLYTALATSERKEGER